MKGEQVSALRGQWWVPAGREALLPVPRTMRGLALLNAATLTAELGDLHRFPTARQLMGYLGLVPSEDSTGEERRQGGITKMGNGIARRALIEAAWVEQTDQGCGVVGAKPVASSLPTPDGCGVARKKKPVAAAALGRELSGFVWAIGRMVQPRPVQAVAAPPPPP